MSQEAIEAAVYRKLIAHLQARTDVQNIDLMGVGGFCRNCLADWYQEAAAALGECLDTTEARTYIYGMDPADYKANYQSKATDEQLALMNASIAKNKDMRGW